MNVGVEIANRQSNMDLNVIVEFVEGFGGPTTEDPAESAEDALELALQRIKLCGSANQKFLKFRERVTHHACLPSRFRGS